MLTWSFAASAVALILVATVLPARLRAGGMVAVSVLALRIVWGVPVLVVSAAVLAVWALGQALPRLPAGGRAPVAGAGVVAIVGAVLWLRTGGAAASPALGAGAVLGLSYLGLKLVQHVVDAAAGRTRHVGLAEYLTTTLLLPTYPAGPIERTTDLARTLAAPPLPWTERVRGAERVVLGIGMKVLLADPLLRWAVPVFESAATATPTALLAAIYAYTLGVYLDFAAYSDLAIGVAALAGLRIRENFDRPFLQPNLAALWQRWHMSLTSWLRDFVFIPVTRRLLRVTGRPLLSQTIGQCLTMLACGLWHGTAWHFALWGLAHGGGLAGRTWWRQWRGPAPASPVRTVVSTVATFHFFAFAVVLFANDLTRSLLVYARLTGLA